MLLVCRVGSIPHPPVFAKRGGKLLKTKERRVKKRGKREQEAANHLQQRTWGHDLTQRALRREAQRTQRKITGGNADVCEKKGDLKKATQKSMMRKELKIDRLRGAVRGGRMEFWRERLEERSSEALLRSIVVEDSSGGTLGQLVGGVVEGQVAGSTPECRGKAS